MGKYQEKKYGARVFDRINTVEIMFGRRGR
jgi:hypothetical protein